MTSNEFEFHHWPKIARLEGETMTVTEKLDGTSSAIQFAEDGKFIAQSRNRFITPEADNYGFAGWVERNAESLFEDLGVGRHFGEWYGQKIQRTYGLDHKRFALFNTHRFAIASAFFKTEHLEVVPVLHEGEVNIGFAKLVDANLRQTGSVAVPGFMNPEGTVVFLNRAHLAYKVTDAVQGQKHRG